MENNNWHKSAQIFIEELSSSNPTPSGGAGGAIAGAMGCALAKMSASTTLKLKKTPEENKIAIETFVSEIEKLKNNLTNASAEDAKVYGLYIEAKKIDKENPERKIKMQEALVNSAFVPLNACKICSESLNKISAIESKISDIIMSDIVCAKNLLNCAKKCLLENVKINLNYIKDEQVKQKLEQEISKL